MYRRGKGEERKMAAKRKSAKQKIIETAWELFMEQGYESTTLQDIIDRSGTSKGAFYHHFRAKEDLLFRMAWYFDQDYDGWLDRQDQSRSSLDLLLDYILYSSEAVENSKYKPFLPELYGYEVMTEGHRYIMDETREYFQFLYKLFRRGIQEGEIKANRTALDYARAVAGLQRGLTYNWLLAECRYSLVDSVDEMIRAYIDSIRA